MIYICYFYSYLEYDKIIILVIYIFAMIPIRHYHLPCLMRLCWLYCIKLLFTLLFFSHFRSSICLFLRAKNIFVHFLGKSFANFSVKFDFFVKKYNQCNHTFKSDIPFCPKPNFFVKKISLGLISNSRKRNSHFCPNTFLQ